MTFSTSRSLLQLDFEPSEEQAEYNLLRVVVRRRKERRGIDPGYRKLLTKTAGSYYSKC